MSLLPGISSVEYSRHFSGRESIFGQIQSSSKTWGKLSATQRGTAFQRGIMVKAGEDGSFSSAPWEVLEVPIDADEKTIKKAYRHMALRHHPDTNPSPEAPFKFLKISQAYEMLMDRKRGKDYVEQKSRRRNSDWSFHDWYWDFMLQQRHKAQGGPSKAKPVLKEDHLHGQLAGLRRRAAGRRKNVKQTEWDTSFTHSEESFDKHTQHDSHTEDSGRSSEAGSSTSFAFEDSHHDLASSGSPADYGHISSNPAHSEHSTNFDSGLSGMQSEEDLESEVNSHRPQTQTRKEEVNEPVEISRQLQGLKRRAARRKDT